MLYTVDFSVAVPVLLLLPPVKRVHPQVDLRKVIPVKGTSPINHRTLLSRGSPFVAGYFPIHRLRIFITPS